MDGTEISHCSFGRSARVGLSACSKGMDNKNHNTQQRNKKSVRLLRSSKRECEDFHMTRPVTVPFQFKEMELFKIFSFMGTGTGDQFTLPELKPVTSSFHLN